MKGDITKVERLEIAILRKKKYSMRSIAKSMGRSPNTISYEIKINSVNGEYSAHKAHQKAQTRKKYRRFQRKLESMKPAPCAHYLKQAADTLHIKSITFDNGIENIYHKDIGVPTYFCDPYSSWQKGAVENVNKMIRRYIPKGTDMVYVSQLHLEWIADRINKKPRKILGYRSAYEVGERGGVLLGD